MPGKLHNFRKIANIVSIIVILFFFLSCAATPPQTSEQKYINPENVTSLIKEKKAAVIDTMSYLECMDHRIPGSLCIALEEFENKSSALLKDKKQPIIFYCESEECPRAGLTYEKAKTAGYQDMYILEGGLPAWKRAGHEVETVERIKRAPVVSIKLRTLKNLAKEKKDLLILDIRSEDAFKAGHLDGAVNIPLYTLHKRLNEIPKNRSVIVVDESGKRSFLACCYLINNGFNDVIRLYGGMKPEELRKVKKGIAYDR